MTGIFEGLVLAALTAIGVVAWWGFRRMVASLDKIEDRLGVINGRVGKMETWQGMHEKSDDDRIDHLEKQTDSLWIAVRARG